MLKHLPIVLISFMFINLIQAQQNYKPKEVSFENKTNITNELAMQLFYLGSTVSDSLVKEKKIKKVTSEYTGTKLVKSKGKNIYNYDLSGKLVTRIYTDVETGLIPAIVDTFIYDKEGKLVETIKTVSEKFPNYYLDFSTGKMVTKQKTIFEYNALGQLINLYNADSSKFLVASFDYLEKSNAIVTKTYYKKGSYFETDTSFYNEHYDLVKKSAPLNTKHIANYLYLHTYNDAAQLVSSIFSNDSFTTIVRYTNYKNGLLKTKIYDNFFPSTKFSYEYY